MATLYGFLMKSESTTPDSTGDCVFLEFGTRVAFIGFSIMSGSRATASTGKRVFPEFGTRFPFIGLFGKVGVSESR